MQWTENIPVEEGWYWYRNQRGGCSVIHVTNAVKKYSIYPGKWFGPILPPS